MKVKTNFLILLAFVVILFLGLIYYTKHFVSEFSLGGPVYQNVERSNALRIDIDPAALYLATDYVYFLELETIVSDQDTLSLEEAQYYLLERHQKFKEKKEYWSKVEFSRESISVNLNQIFSVGDEFYFTAQSFFHDLSKKELRANYAEVLSRLKPLFATNRSLIDIMTQDLSDLHAFEMQETTKRTNQLFFQNIIVTSFVIGLIVIIFFTRIYRQTELIVEKSLQSQKDLEENKLLTFKLEQSSRELKNLNLELESFSYTVAHDLRSPLRALNGFSQILKEDFADILPAEANSYLDRITAASQKMGALIDDILQLSRISREELQFSRTDLSKLAREIVQSLNYDLEKYKIDIDPTPMVDVDGRMMKIALTNLLDNALKYSSKTVGPCVRFGFDDKQGHFYVKDNGVGFDMRYSAKIFSPFQRLHSSKDYPGTGVGLATVKTIIKKHAGDINFESIPDQGTTFYFNFLANLELNQRLEMS